MFLLRVYCLQVTETNLSYFRPKWEVCCKDWLGLGGTLGTARHGHGPFLKSSVLTSPSFAVSCITVEILHSGQKALGFYLAMFLPAKARDTVSGKSNQMSGASPVEAAEVGLSVEQALKSTHCREHSFIFFVYHTDNINV